MYINALQAEDEEENIAQIQVSCFWSSLYIAYRQHLSSYRLLRLFRRNGGCCFAAHCVTVYQGAWYRFAIAKVRCSDSQFSLQFYVLGLGITATADFRNSGPFGLAHQNQGACPFKVFTYNHSLNGSSDTVNGNLQFLWVWANFNPPQNQYPWTDGQKNLHNWLHPPGDFRYQIW